MMDFVFKMMAFVTRLRRSIGAVRADETAGNMRAALTLPGNLHSNDVFAMHFLLRNDESDVPMEMMMMMMMMMMMKLMILVF